MVTAVPDLPIFYKVYALLLFQLKSCTLITIKVQNETMLILLTLMSAFRS
jgi:hypothetical protein